MEIRNIELTAARILVSAGKLLMERIFIILIFLLFLVSTYCGYLYYQYAVKIDDVELVVEAKVMSIEKEKLSAVMHALDEKDKIQAGQELSVGRDIFR